MSSLDDLLGGCDVEAFVAAVPQVLGRLDVSGFDRADLERLLRCLRLAQRSLDGAVIKAGARANELAAQGVAAPAEETVRGGGAVGAAQARREAARVRTVEQLPALGDAVAAGATTGEHVDSIARHTAKLSDEQRAGFDFDSLVDRAQQGLPVETFDRHVKRQVAAATAGTVLGDVVAKRAASQFRHWFDRDTGMGRFSGALDPERYEQLTNAVDQHMTAIAQTSRQAVTKNHNLAAEALVELATTNGGRGTGRRMPSVTVIVDHDTILGRSQQRSVCQTETGHDIPRETVDRLCCDAVVRRVTLDETGVPINVGRRYRTATDAQWTALKAIHTSCAWDLCDRPINWCQAHHIKEWEHGGTTDLDNLVPLCSRHHHRVHEGHWHIKLLPDRTLETHQPDGTHHTTTPPPMRC